MPTPSSAAEAIDEERKDDKVRDPRTGGARDPVEPHAALQDRAGPGVAVADRPVAR